MGHPKGSIVITAESDIPLLLQVRNSLFVSHQQLFEFLRHDASAFSRSTFNWRIRRLLKTGHIAALQGIWWQGSPIYLITRTGLIELASLGHFGISLSALKRRMLKRPRVFHALELNEIRLSLWRHELLISWQTGVEISYANMVSSSPYQVDYDAIVQIWVADEVREFALAYDRWHKRASQYEQIRRALEAERRVSCVLYLVPSRNLVIDLVHKLTPLYCHLGFATAFAFREQLFSTSVMTGARHPLVTFGEFLEMELC